MKGADTTFPIKTMKEAIPFHCFPQMDGYRGTFQSIRKAENRLVILRPHLVNELKCKRRISINMPTDSYITAEHSFLE